MKKNILLIISFILLSIHLTHSQEPKKPNTFLKSWIGKYQGELELYGVNKIGMKIPMQLIVAQKSDSIFQWKMIYNPQGKNDARDYEIKIKDVTKGHYIIDEKNSILIDAFYKNETLTSHFEVMESFILTSYHKLDDQTIVFDLFSSKKTGIVSGNTKVDNNTIPEVKSYTINGRQKAVLKKIE